MNPLTPNEIELLLGGYATGTLTPAENDALMRAALADQSLFDALMDEEALRETLADPDTRAALIRTLSPREAARPWFRNPWPWAALVTAAASVFVFVLVRQPAPQRTAEQRIELARNLPKPEPISVPLPTPKSLTYSQPRQPLQVTPVTPPPAPAAPPASEQREALRADAPLRMVEEKPAALPAGAPAAAQIAADAVRQEPVMKQAADKKLDKDERDAASPLQIAIAFQQPDGTWRDLPAGAPAPAGRALRLTVTSETPGLLALTPPLAVGQRVEANKPAIVVIPAQAAGELALRLTVTAETGNVMGGMRAAKARAAATASVAGYLQQPLTREIRLKIE